MAFTPIRQSADAALWAERELLTASVAPEARHLSRRIRAAIRKNPISKARLIDLGKRLNAHRRADDPYYLNGWLVDYRAVLEAECRWARRFA